MCAVCGAILTDEERYYYDYQCEKCERADMERIEAWRNGASDPELDALYSVPPPILH